jgi:uncharacterized protein (TIGR02271 family)
MFDSRSDAEAARDRLSQYGIDASRVRIIDKEAGVSATGSEHQEGFWSSLKDMFMPEEDRHAYGEGIRRGGYMLAAEVDESRADKACRLLDEAGSVDFDQRQSEWRSQGWSGFGAGQQAGAFGRPSNDDEYDSDRPHGRAEERGTVAEERIPVIEEDLKISKREVERGGARVRSYVREVPVHEQVRLREEHVEVERRPVDEPLRGPGQADEIFRDHEIEMTERAEEAVISKEARVTEEVVLRKTAGERTENVDDTVRKTEVDIDREGAERSVFSNLDRDNNREDLADRKDGALERSSSKLDRERDEREL